MEAREATGVPSAGLPMGRINFPTRLLFIKSEGYHNIVNQKKFLRMRTRKPRSNLGDIINERDRRDLHTLEKIA
jgi:hypothetical protein